MDNSHVSHVIKTHRKLMGSSLVTFVGDKWAESGDREVESWRNDKEVES